MINQPTVTIAIAAHNAGAQIANLIYSLLTQLENGFLIESIIVHADAPKDNTIAIVKNLNQPRIKLVSTTKPIGFARVVKKILSQSTSDFTVILNDDIKIGNNKFISELIKTIQQPKVGLVCGNPLPFSNKKFIQKSILSTFNAFRSAALKYRSGNNKHLCDGKIMCLSRQFISSISFPKEYGQMGNTDAFLYFSCLKSKFKFRFAKKAIAYYVFPNTLSDFISWNTRNSSQKALMKSTFGLVVDQEYHLPLLTKYKLLETIKNPFGAIYIFFIGLYCKHKSKSLSKNFASTWETVASTKTQF